MVTPAGQGVSLQGPGAHPALSFPPILPPRLQTVPTHDDRPAPTAENAGRQQADQARQRAEDARAENHSQQQPSLQDIDVQFRIIQQAHLAQARVINQDTQEILREVPDTARIVFDLHFDQAIGRHIDVSA